MATIATDAATVAALASFGRPPNFAHNIPPQVLMYCTGGIRCEKTSAFIRQTTGATSVHHLKGGIHRYLEAYGADGHWLGKNFVFDRRQSVDGGGKADLDTPLPDALVVGRCYSCDAPHDRFTPDAVCAVCREPVLICPPCRALPAHVELHCDMHADLRGCYFNDLRRFDAAQLQRQVDEVRMAQ